MLVFGLGKVSSIKHPQGAHANELPETLEHTHTCKTLTLKTVIFAKLLSEGECTVGLGF